MAEDGYDFSLDDVVNFYRRNEIILNKTTNDAKGIIIVASNPDDDRLKKFSAGVVEYGSKVGTFLSYVITKTNGRKQASSTTP